MRAAAPVAILCSSCSPSSAAALDPSYRSAVASLMRRQSHNPEDPAQFIATTFKQARKGWDGGGGGRGMEGVSHCYLLKELLYGTCPPIGGGVTVTC